MQRLITAFEPVETTDSELLMRFAKHDDSEAFCELVNRHQTLVMSVCRRVLRHVEDAEDAFQATFFTLAKNAGRVQATASCAGWLHRVAFRTSLRRHADVNSSPLTSA